MPKSQVICGQSWWLKFWGKTSKTTSLLTVLDLEAQLAEDQEQEGQYKKQLVQKKLDAHLYYIMRMGNGSGIIMISLHFGTKIKSLP